VHGRSLLLSEFPQPAEKILRIPSERETESTFHANSIRTQ